ncbi:6327_t:CDS:1 [Acaulospora colombiana]|uniref:6327_t:CDS:1 n=1 Tax=Acaulospora colombiana TaxID=27376 RepID=A0ACA9JWK5_9GLOM|nr:6327_t:CDS:1 [Acaulospora colombiana]
MAQWYNGSIPDIKHFFFIKSTEDLCFVEKSGRTRVYMFSSNQFRPESLQLPSNFSKVLSTPDGSCIVAFVREIAAEEGEKNDNIESDTEKINDITEFVDPVSHGSVSEDNKEGYQAHIFFYAKFGRAASKGNIYF